jgi:hypothetical protein
MLDHFGAEAVVSEEDVAASEDENRFGEDFFDHRVSFRARHSKLCEVCIINICTICQQKKLRHLPPPHEQRNAKQAHPLPVSHSE